MLKHFTEKGARSDDGDAYDWKAAYLKLREEFDLYRKRVANTTAAERMSQKRELLSDFLDTVDFMRHTYRAKNVNGTATKEDDMVLNRLYATLWKYGVSPMKDATGTPFDVNLQEAILVDRSGMFESGSVTMVLEQGFMLGDEVLRHAKVMVAEEPGDDEPSLIQS